MKCDFVVDQKVVCVDADWGPGVVESGIKQGIQFPVFQAVYTVRGFVLIGDIPLVLLNEVRNPTCAFHSGMIMEPAWSHTRFRPLETRKTDISIFKRMLTPAGGVPVDA